MANNSGKLIHLGWSAFFEKHLGSHSTEEVGKVTELQRKHYTLETSNGELIAELGGAFVHKTEDRADFPTVGDWVVFGAKGSTARIDRVLPRKTKLSRVRAGETSEEQVMAANVDVVFVVIALNDEINFRRLERFLVVVGESGAKSVVILSKADVARDFDGDMKGVRDVARDAEVIPTSVSDGRGLTRIRELIPTGQSCVFIGISGVGKSSLVNALLSSDLQIIGGIRDWDKKGRHTTTARSLFFLPGGGMVIDTPGLREIQVLADDDSLDESFDDVDEIALRCKFTNCTHDTEPGCAVRLALEKGALTQDRLKSYLKLQAQLAHTRKRVENRKKKK